MLVNSSLEVMGRLFFGEISVVANSRLEKLLGLWIEFALKK